MPTRNEKEEARRRRRNNELLDKLDNQLDNLYKSTYFSDTTSDELFDSVSDELSDSIRKITDNDPEYQNLSNITTLYQKLANKVKGSGDLLISNLGKDNDKDISTLFQTNEMMASLMEVYARTKWITELDSEFDMICKYMPKLKAALDIKRDAVLCSDSYTKEYINITAKNETSGEDKNTEIITGENGSQDFIVLERTDMPENGDEKIDSGEWYDSTKIFEFPLRDVLGNGTEERRLYVSRDAANPNTEFTDYTIQIVSPAWYGYEPEPEYDYGSEVFKYIEDQVDADGNPRQKVYPYTQYLR